MGLKYLWDTNTVIYYLQKHFPAIQEKLMDDIINDYQPAISVITEIELLCWKNATAKDLITLNSFISDCVVFELDQPIKLKTVEIRKQSGLKLPDSLIAATALSNELILISRNTADFKKITNLELIDLFDNK
jgi:predicted nucleic acid-binding protein